MTSEPMTPKSNEGNREEKATPRPWFSRNAGVRVKTKFGEFKIADCLIDRTMSPAMSQGIGSYSGFADADLIVTAVNERDALLEKAKIYEEALRYIDRLSNEWSANRLGGVHVQRARWEKLWAVSVNALNAAEEKKA